MSGWNVTNQRKSRVMAIGTALAAFLSVGSPGGPLPAHAGSGPATWAPKKVEVVPAFARDLPIGTARFGPSTTSSSSGASTLSASAATWICSVYASDPYLSQSLVGGDGWQSCTGAGFQQTALRVTIQTYWGLGLWKDRSSQMTNWTNYSWLERHPQYSCSGMGVYTYRVVTDGWAVYGNYHQAVQSLNYYRFYC
jgi:hypothetical protein